MEFFAIVRTLMRNAEVLIKGGGTKEEKIDEKMFGFGRLKRDLRTIRLTTTLYSYALQKVFRALSNKGVVAVPTDTVYGLISLLHYADRVSAIKERPADKPLGLFVDTPETISLFAVQTVPTRLLRQLYPGAVTLVFQRKEGALPSAFNAGASTIAFRIPNNCFIQDICRHYPGQPLVQTSANVSGSSLSPLKIEDFKKLHDQLALIIDNGEILEHDGSREGSTVVDLSTPGHYKIIRNGCVMEKTEETLRKFGIKPVPIVGNAESSRVDELDDSQGAISAPSL